MSGGLVHEDRPYRGARARGFHVLGDQQLHVVGWVGSNALGQRRAEASVRQGNLVKAVQQCTGWLTGLWLPKMASSSAEVSSGVLVARVLCVGLLDRLYGEGAGLTST